MHESCFTASGDENERLKKLREKNSLHCGFQDLTYFDCYCSYFDDELNEETGKNFHYTGTALYDWHRKHNITSIQLHYLPSSTQKTSFSRLFTDCSRQHSNILVRCIYFSHSHIPLTCFCTDKDLNPTGPRFRFNFREVFPVQFESIFSGKIPTNRPTIFADLPSPTSNTFVSTHDDTITTEKNITPSFTSIPQYTRTHVKSYIIALPILFFFFIFVLFAIWLYKNFKNYKKQPNTIVEIDLTNET